MEFFAEEAKRVYGDIIPATLPDRRLFVLKQVTVWVEFLSSLFLIFCGSTTKHSLTLTETLKKISVL